MLSHIEFAIGIVIPFRVWKDKRLSITEKGIFAVINELSCGRTCTASNQELSERCQCTTRTISSAISKLIKLNYIRLMSFDGRTRTLSSNFRVTEAGCYWVNENGGMT